MTRLTKILAPVLLALVLTATLQSNFSLRAQVGGDAVTTDTASSESSAASLDANISSAESSDTSSAETSSTLTRLERRLLQASSEISSAASSADTSSVESVIAPASESASSASSDDTSSEASSVASTTIETVATDTGSTVETETGATVETTSSEESSESSLSSESSSEQQTQAFSGGELLNDAVLGQPTNVYPAFRIPKTSDFNSIWDVQTRIHITLTDDAGLAQPVDETVTEETADYRITLAPPATFRPGRYRFQAALNHTTGFSAVLLNAFRKIVGADAESDLMLVDTYFDWGTIAVNVDKNSYTTGGDILLTAAAMTDDGKPLCVETLTSSFVDGDTQTLSHFCSGSGETLTLHAPSGTSATLITTANDTDTQRTVKKLIVIENTPAVRIARTSVTRTEAGRTEHMMIKVTTDRPVIGTITERVAPGFEVSGIQPAPTDISHNVDGTFISWDGSFAPSATRQFSYDYQTGTTSPLFAFMGPIRFRGQAETPEAPVVTESSVSSVASSDVSLESSTSSISASSESTTSSIGVSAASSAETSDTASAVSSVASSIKSSLHSSIMSSVDESSEMSASDVSTSATSDSSESSSTGDVGFIQGFFQNILASLTLDETNHISFQEDDRWQLLVTTGAPDISVTERARRLTLERAQAVFAANASPTFKLVDTVLDGTDARLLDGNNNLRSAIAYQEILHTVVADEDVTSAIVDHLVAKAQDTTDFGTVTPDAVKEDSAVQETVAALVTDDAKDKMITSIADQIAGETDTTISTMVDTAATSVVQTQTTALANAQNAVTQAVTENGTERASSPETSATGSSVLSVILQGPDGIAIHPPFHFEVGSVDLVIDPIQSFVPGLYSVIVTVTNPITGEVQTFTQQFAWGVLAMNPDKDVYKEGDTAHIDLGALDDHGEIVCDADLKLTTVAPNGTTSILSTAQKTIIQTDTCGVKKAGLIDPDFWAELPLTQSGSYHLTLEGTIKGKTRAITSIIVVQNDAPFIISRLGATRLWPFGNSPMDIKVLFNTDVNGEVVETVPAGFVIKGTNPNGTITKDDDGTSHITWDGNWKAGEEPMFHYDYKAPEISPHFFLLGPVKIQSEQPFTGAHLTASGQTIE